MLRQAQTAINIYTADDARPELAEKWESGLRALVDEAEAGSDHQLALVRAYANAASGPVRLRELIDGGLEGLAVDTDLRWTLLTALARLGEADEAEIAAELERDNTISGQEHAASARAIQPLAEAKAAAWEAVTSVATCPTRHVARSPTRSRCPARASCSSRTSTATSRWPRPCSRRRACGWRRSR